MFKLKTCKQCEKKLSVENYPDYDTFKKNLPSRCKDCISENNRRYYEANRHRQKSKSYQYQQKLKQNKERMHDYLILKYESIPCMDCDTIFPWCAMDWDHRPGEVKEFTISSEGWAKATPERIAKFEHEITKCDLVCANCHRIRTWKRKNNE